MLSSAAEQLSQPTFVPGSWKMAEVLWSFKLSSSLWYQASTSLAGQSIKNVVNCFLFTWFLSTPCANILTYNSFETYASLFLIAVTLNLSDYQFLGYLSCVICIIYGHCLGRTFKLFGFVSNRCCRQYELWSDCKTRMPIGGYFACRYYVGRDGDLHINIWRAW